MEPLCGSYELKLDSKQRISLPGAIRRALEVHAEQEIMITIGPDGCITGASLDGWAQRYLPLLQSLSWTRAEDRALLRDIAPRTFKVRIDTENRITLPQPLLAWAGIRPGAAVVAQGLLTHFEIWEASRLQARDATGISFEDRLEGRLGREPEDKAPSS